MTTQRRDSIRDRIARAYGIRVLADPRRAMFLLCALLVVVLAWRLAQFAIFSRQIQWGYDFSAYWNAAERVVQGASPYDAGQLAGTYSPQQQYLYLYPPFLAAALAPARAVLDLPYTSAAWAWAALGLGLLVFSVLAIAWRGDPAPRRRSLAWLALALALAFPPVVGELVMGNVHLEILALLAIAWIGLCESSARGERVAGLAIAIATILKVFPVLLIAWLALRGRWAAVRWSIAGTAILAALSLPFTSVTAWLDYPTVLLNLGPPVDSTDTLAPTVWLTALLSPGAARLVVLFAAGCIVLVAGRRGSLRAGYAAVAITSLLAAPALYHHYLAVAVLPLLLAILEGVSSIVVILAYFLMWGGNQGGLGDAAWIVNRLLPSTGVLLLFCGLMFVILRRPREVVDYISGSTLAAESPVE